MKLAADTVERTQADEGTGKEAEHHELQEGKLDLPRAGVIDQLGDLARGTGIQAW